MIGHTLIKRQDANLNPADGIVHAEHFQIAYATTDIEQAKALFAQRYGIRNFRQLSGPLPDGGEIHVELAWLGPVMYELLCARGPGTAIYREGLPDHGFAIRLHHLGYLIHDQPQWDALQQRIVRENWDMPTCRSNPGFLQSCFVRAPELGHLLEYIHPEEAGRRFFEDVPHN